MNWVGAKLVLTGADGINYEIDGRINDFSINVQHDTADFVISSGGPISHIPTGVSQTTMDISLMIDNVDQLVSSLQAVDSDKAEEVDRLYRRLNL